MGTAFPSHLTAYNRQGPSLFNDLGCSLSAQHRQIPNGQETSRPVKTVRTTILLRGLTVPCLPGYCAPVQYIRNLSALGAMGGKGVQVHGSMESRKDTPGGRASEMRRVQRQHTAIHDKIRFTSHTAITVATFCH